MMKNVGMVAVALFVGCALGAGAISGLHAQGAKKPAYVVAEVQVTDPAAFQAYAAKVPDTLKPYNGRTIVRGKGDALEGEPPKGSVVVLAFDSLEDARKWYDSAAYLALIPEPQKSATSRVHIVEGVPQ
jgi:uncharacterized protein (DUF1330 family)